MRNRNLLYCWAIAALLGGCSTTATRTPAPVSEPMPSAPPQSSVPGDAGGVQIRAYESPAPVQATSVHGRAVVALLDNAGQQQAQGDYTAAAATLERALRIEPRNGHLWHRLAKLRMEQGQYRAAADLAERSNTLAGGDLVLQRDNWRLIARARRATGDIAGARAAERKAQSLN